MKPDFDVSALDPFSDTLRWGLGCKQIFVGTLIPYDNFACAVLALGNLTAKTRVLEGMVFDVHRQAFFRRIESWLLWDGPALEHAIRFETKVVVQPRRVMFLDYE